MMAKVLQLNINHSGPALDNLRHLMEELDAGLAIVAEPYRVPPKDERWHCSTDDPPTAAIIWRKTRGKFLPLQKLSSGLGFCFAE